MNSWYAKKFKWLKMFLIGALILQASMMTTFLNIKSAKAEAPTSNVVLNEFVSDSSDNIDWVELYNNGAASQELTGWYLKDGSPGGNKLDLSDTLGVGSFTASDWSNKLNKNTDTITLYDSNNTQIDTITYPTDVAAPAQDKSAARLPDGGVWTADQTPTKGEANSSVETLTVDAGDDVTTNTGFIQDATVTGATGDLTYGWTYTVPEEATLDLTDIDKEDVTVNNASQEGVYTLTLTATDSDDPENPVSDSFILTWEFADPQTATVITPENEQYYNQSNMPSTFDGKAADDILGTGLEADSTTFYLKNSDDQYWTGSEWLETATWLETIHDETTDGSEVIWTSSAVLPETWENGIYTTTVKVINKNEKTLTGTEIEFYIENSEIYVDASNISDPDEDGTLEHPFDTIQEAIDAANSGYTINVAAGTYTENVIISSDASGLKLTGHSKDDTFISINSGNAITVDSPITIDGFTIDCQNTAYYGIYTNSASDIVIQNNIIKDYYKAGILVEGGAVSITNNEIAGRGLQEDYSADSIYTKSGATVTVTDNILRNNKYAGNIHKTDPEDWSTAAGLSVHQSDTVAATGNIIHDNDFGIHAKGGETEGTNPTVIAHFNNIYENSQGFFYEVRAGGAPSSNYDATNNWWGSDDPVFADLVSDNVIYDSWWTTETGVPSKQIVVTANDIYTNKAQPTLTWEVDAAPAVDDQELDFDNGAITASGSALPSNQFTIPYELEDGEYDWKVKGHNSPNNYDHWTEWQEAKLYVDTVAPTGSITINNNAPITSSKTVNLGFTRSDANVNKMRFGEKQFSVDDTSEWQDFVETGEYTFESEGQKTIYAQFMDKAGNTSETYPVSIYYSTAAGTTADADVLAQDDQNFQFGELVDIILSATNTTKLHYTEYVRNPEKQASGLTAFGKYFDLSVDDNSVITFPVMIKIWFTQADLDAIKANVDQIKGLYYWNFDSSTWKLYADSGKVLEENGDYIGYVWANADHFTPMMSGADITAPEIPNNFKAETQDSAVKLTWDKVNDAATYNIRYRKGTSDDPAEPYTTIYVSCADNTEYTIAGLTNDIMYQFNISATDSAGNEGKEATIITSPNKSGETVSDGVLVPAKKTLFGYRGHRYKTANVAQTTEKDDETKDDEKEETTIETITPEGEVEGAEDEEDAQESSRAVVTLAILIIAAGAGLGGYYGYQWWLGKEAVETTVKTKKDDKKDKGGRW